MPSQKKSPSDYRNFEMQKRSEVQLNQQSCTKMLQPKDNVKVSWNSGLSVSSHKVYKGLGWMTFPDPTLLIYFKGWSNKHTQHLQQNKKKLLKMVYTAITYTHNCNYY